MGRKGQTSLAPNPKQGEGEYVRRNGHKPKNGRGM